MKKLSIVLFVVLLLLSITNCKKNIEKIMPSDGVAINLVINNNSKLDVDPPHTTFTNGDVIYVGYDGLYAGTITYNGTYFTGTITATLNGTQKLYFYLLGNKNPHESLVEGSSTECTVNISNQINELPVLSMAASNEYYTGAGTYTAALDNKCGLVKFVPSIATANAIIISGMKTTALINFETHSITPTNDIGDIISYSMSDTEKWAILLPQNNVENPNVKINSYDATISSVPTVTLNMYYPDGIAVSMTQTGKLIGEFTVNNSGDKVHFSQGNLQYLGSSGAKWKLADNQWTYLGNHGQGSISQNVDRDLFGWGTSGWNCGNEYYQPYCTNGSYASRYGPYGEYDLTGAYANSDWGVYNKIVNGGNQAGLWRTMSKDEWNSILFDRTTASNIHFAFAQVCGVKGVILLPDDWESSLFSLIDTDMSGSSYFNSNVISASEWHVLESYGAVFLPAAGERSADVLTNIGSWGYYWTSSFYNSSRAYSYTFGNALYGSDRFHGFAVRLVSDVQ